VDPHPARREPGGPVGPRERRFSARRAFETFGLVDYLCDNIIDDRAKLCYYLISPSSR